MYDYKFINFIQIKFIELEKKNWLLLWVASWNKFIIAKLFFFSYYIKFSLIVHEK